MKRTIGFLLCLSAGQAQGFGDTLSRKAKDFAAAMHSTVFSKRAINLASIGIAACVAKQFQPSLPIADLTCAGVVGCALSNSFQSYFQERNMIKYYVDLYARGTLVDPVPDCPVKRKITQKFTQHGYEVFFAKRYAWTTHNAAVLAHGKKVIFFVFGDGQHTFFTDPELDAARDGIIEHEIAHVLNGDLAQRAASRSFTKNLITAGFTCAFIKALTGDYTSLIHNLSSLSGLPSLAKTVDISVRKGISQTGSLIAEHIPATVQSSVKQANIQAIALLPAQVQEGLAAVGEKIVKTATAPDVGARVAACLGIKWLAEKNIGWSSALINAMVSRYHEKRADYAALKLKDPAALRGMAAFFKKTSHGRDKRKKSWEQWWYEKLTHSHPCPCSRHHYLEKEAEKMSKAQKQGAAHLVSNDYDENRDDQEVFA